MIKRLFAGALIQGQAPTVGESASIERRALLVYEGTFQSGLDGEVVVSAEALHRLAGAYNAVLSAQGDNPPVSALPPVQLDHSDSATATVGRVVGALEAKEVEEEGPAKGRLGLYGNLRFLGQENVDRVNDGRWVHLSIGADFDTGKLVEVTVTPFPAAKEAKLLSLKGTEMSGKKSLKTPENKDRAADRLKAYEEQKARFAAAKRVKSETIGECDVEVYQDEDGSFYFETWKNGSKKDEGGGYSSVDKALYDAKDYIKYKKLSQGLETVDATEGMGKQTEVGAGGGMPMTHDQLVEACMAKWACSKEEVEGDLAKLTYGEVQRMAVEGVPEHRHGANGEVVPPAPKGNEVSVVDTPAKKELSAANTRLSSKLAEARLTLRTQSVRTRLSSLRAQGKVTPAEMKKIDVAKLARLSQEGLDAVLGSYDAREPVIIPGLYGTAKGMTTTQLAAEVGKKTKSVLEAEARAQMSLKKTGAKSRLCETTEDKEEGVHNTHLEGTDAHTVSSLSEAEADDAFERMCKMVADGDKDGAKSLFKQCAGRMTAESTDSEDSLKHLSAALDAIEEEQGRIVKLAGAASGARV